MKKILTLILIANLFGAFFSKETLKNFFSKETEETENERDLANAIYLILENNEKLQLQLQRHDEELKVIQGREYNKTIESINEKLIELELKIEQIETNIQKVNYQLMEKNNITSDRLTRANDKLKTYKKTINENIQDIEGNLKNLEDKLKNLDEYFLSKGSGNKRSSRSRKSQYNKE